MLDVFGARDGAKRTFQVVAPPGSGKTLVGLDIARRVGSPAVTFSPTTTIQEQWKDKVRLFIPAHGPEAGAFGERHVSADPGHLGVLSSLTYQSPGHADERTRVPRRLGRQAWLVELMAAGRTPEAAEAYVADLEARGRAVASEQIRKHAGRRTRALLESGDATVEQLLHPNAVGLIERIVSEGTARLRVRTAVLEEWR